MKLISYLLNPKSDTTLTALLLAQTGPHLLLQSRDPTRTEAVFPHSPPADPRNAANDPRTVGVRDSEVGHILPLIAGISLDMIFLTLELSRPFLPLRSRPIHI